MKSSTSLLLLIVIAAVAQAVLLTEPPNVYSEDGWLNITLTVEPGRVGGPVSFTTRTYNASVPAPTWNIYPGDIIYLKLINMLDENGDDDYVENWFHTPNTTAMHTHGLHVSPALGADHMFEGIDPHTTGEYIYEVPDDHYPGTHLYHGHYHGSTALQMFAGMAGNIIVHPEEDVLDPFLASIDWTVAYINHWYITPDDEGGNFQSIIDMIGWCNDTMDWNIEYNYSWYDTDSSDFTYGPHVVNGLFQPEVQMKAGEWKGFRFTNGGAQYIMELAFMDDDFFHCDTLIVARDGVYLDNPLSEDAIILLPATRADVLIRCHEAGEYGLYNDATGEDREWIFSSENYVHRLSTFLLMTFVVEGEANEIVEFPTTWTPPERPGYLSDLRNIDDNMIAGKFQIKGTFHYVTETELYPGFNNQTFCGEECYTYNMTVNKYYEFNYTCASIEDEGSGSHPFHMHVNHVQIIDELIVDSDETNTDEDAMRHNPIYQIGEWRDTVQAFESRVTVVRFPTDRYSGTVPFHCHFLIHSELGMFTVLNIDDDGSEPAYISHPWDYEYEGDDDELEGNA